MKNSKGFTFIEMIVAAAIVGIVAYASIAVVGMLNSQLKGGEQYRAMEYLHSATLARGRQMLLNVKDAEGRNTRGLCHSTLISVPFNTPGVGLVRANVNSTATNQVFDQAIWTTAFAPDWQIVECQRGDNFMKQCFALSPTSPLAKGQPDRISVQFFITPLNLDPTTGSGTFSPLANDAGLIDAKKVAYELKSTITVEKVGQPDQSTSESFVSEAKGLMWAAEIGHCDRVAEDQSNLKVALSASGLGDFEANTLYNTTRFDERSRPSPLEITVQHRAIMGGEIVQFENQDYMKADTTRNAQVACTEIRYRCPQVNTPRQFDSELGFRTNIRYFALNEINSRVEAEFMLNPQIRARGSRTDLLAGRRTDLWYNLGDRFLVEDRGRMRLLNSRNRVTDEEWRLGGAQARTQMNVTIRNSAPMCQQICSSSNSHELHFMATLFGYNRDGSNYVEDFLGTDRIACKACYMKSCNRFGVAVFGPMGEQPPEPLDSAVPECAARSVEERVKQEFVPPTAPSPLAPNRCFSARLVGGRVQLSLRDCSESLPVMCFGFGRFVPGRQVTTMGDYTFPRVGFNQAQRVCYEMAREKGDKQNLVDMLNTANRDDIAQELASLNRMVPQSTYNLINVANQASFLAPQSSEQWAQLTDTLTRPAQLFVDPRYPNISNLEFWIGLKTMGDSRVVPDVPVAQTRNVAEENFAIYYEANGRPKVAELGFVAASDVIATGSGVGVLVNHIKYRGLVFAAPSSAVQRWVVCRTNNGDSTVLGPSTLAGASDTCERSGAVFAPPTSPLGWVHAKQELAAVAGQASPDYPYPEPTVTGTRTLRVPATAWVSLETDNIANGQASNFRMPSNHAMARRLFSMNAIIAAQATCVNFASAQAAHQAAAAAAAAAVPPRPAPSAPTPPPWDCPIDLNAPPPDILNNYGEYSPPGLAANLRICERANGDWETAPVGSNCAGGRRIAKNDLNANYLALTKWLLLRGRLSSNDRVAVSP